MGTTLVIFLFLALCVAAAVAIGVYVWTDAKKRGMDALLWTIVSLFVPGLIGFIIYLLVRGKYSNMKCPKCSSPVKEEFTVCPNCGAKLRPSCPNCGAAVDDSWKLCPYCGTHLPEVQTDYTPPVKPKDRTLIIVLCVIVIVPVIIMVLSFRGFSTITSGGSCSLTTFTVDTYLNDVNNGEIEKWLDDVGGEYDKAYALMNKSETEDGLRIRYLIYIPQLTERHSCSFSVQRGLFDPVLKIEFSGTDEGGGNTLALATYNGEKEPKLKLYYGDELLECEITEVDYHIGITDGSEYDTSYAGEGVPAAAGIVTEENAVPAEP